MTLKFRHDFAQLKERVKACRVAGERRYIEKNDRYQFKAEAGENLNWWPSTGTITFRAVVNQSWRGASPRDWQNKAHRQAGGKRLPLIQGSVDPHRVDAIFELRLSHLGVPLIALYRLEPALGFKLLKHGVGLPAKLGCPTGGTQN